MSKLIVGRKHLIRGLSILEGITGGKHINPICSSVLFNVTGEKAVLKATNLEDSIETHIPLIQVDFDGQFLVYGPQLLGFIKELGDEEITLLLDDTSSTLSIVSSNPEAVISLVPNEEFPSLPSMPDSESLFPIPSGVFIEAVEKTAFSTSSEHESRVLYGINIVLDGESLKVTSSDGFRFSRYTCSVDNPSNVGFSVILPRRRAQDIKRVISMLFDAEEEILVGYEGNHFFLGTNSLSVFSRTVDEEYPDYESIIPSEYTRKIVVEKSRLIQAIKRVCLFSSERIGGVKIQFDPEGKLIHISSIRYADEPFIGKASESVELVNAQGEPVTIGVSYKNMLDCLSVLRGEEVTLDFGDVLWPVRFTSESDPGFYHILMPMQLDEIES